MAVTRVARYDLESLPKFPFPVWFLDLTGEVSPKKMFRVTDARINSAGDGVEVFVSELNSFVEYDPKKIDIPKLTFLN